MSDGYTRNIDSATTADSKSKDTQTNIEKSRATDETKSSFLFAIGFAILLALSILGGSMIGPSSNLLAT